MLLLKYDLKPNVHRNSVFISWAINYGYTRGKGKVQEEKEKKKEGMLKQMGLKA
jgi:hypothetical protein